MLELKFAIYFRAASLHPQASYIYAVLAQESLTRPGFLETLPAHLVGRSLTSTWKSGRLGGMAIPGFVPTARILQSNQIAAFKCSLIRLQHLKPDTQVSILIPLLNSCLSTVTAIYLVIELFI